MLIDFSSHSRDEFDLEIISIDDMVLNGVYLMYHAIRFYREGKLIHYSYGKEYSCHDASDARRLRRLLKRKKIKK